MLTCYAIDEKLLTSDKGEVADIYACTRHSLEPLLEKYKDKFAKRKELEKELSQNLSTQIGASDRFKIPAKGKLIAINLHNGEEQRKEGDRAAYLWLQESSHDLWGWAELPARLLEIAKQKIFRIVEPREQKARAKAILAWGLATYSFDKFRSNASSSPLRLLLDDAGDVALRSQAKCAEIICSGRSLINSPANIIGPQGLEQAVREFAKDSGGVLHRVLGEELLKQNYPLIHAVGKSAREAPRLIDVRWQASASKKKSLTIVGKGVCFDSGGLNLKGASSMLMMKKDMGGAANAICLARLLLASDCPIQLRLLLPIAENAVSRDAMRPLDIYPSRKGDNVEIGHTDAEGRLLLADALWEASSPQRNKQGEKLKITTKPTSTDLVPPDLVTPDLAPPDLIPPDLVIDFATLTGAARVATGPQIPNLFTNNDSLAEKAARSAEDTQDPIWRMPLWQEYRSVLYSRCADISSASSWPYAGAITAALFLQNFVAQDIMWIHIDNMAWNEKTTAGRPEGGEIQAVRAIAELVEKWSRE